MLQMKQAMSLIHKFLVYLIHKFLSIAPLVTSLLLVSLFSPPFALFKVFKSWLSSPETVAGKVVLITGASSGIGEHLAYEYARRGARLALVARREDRLQAVANNARKFGSPDVIAKSGDVSKPDDCNQFISEALKHFGSLDHLVNNAGIAPLCLFEEYNCITDHASVMDINFWGSVYSTHFALPYLRKSKGKIVVLSSCGAWSASPRLSIYNASKAALIAFYETLASELGSDVGVTIVTPGLVESEITSSEFLSKINMNSIRLESTEVCAKAIVNSTIRGERFLTVPAWMKVLYVLRFIIPEVHEWLIRSITMGVWSSKISLQGDATDKNIFEANVKSLNSVSTNLAGFKTE